MPISGLDHVAITVHDVEATIAWYESVLGAEALYLDLWRSGAIPIAMLQVGSARLSIHPAVAPASPHAARPTPGAADLCFRFDGAVAEILDRFEAAAVPIVEGPVSRPASNGAAGTSVYVRDPDGNLVELLTVS